jgi:hypothetical protein
MSGRMRDAIERERFVDGAILGEPRRRNAEEDDRLFAAARRDPIVESLAPVYGGDRQGRPYRVRRRRESRLARFLGWLLS